MADRGEPTWRPVSDVAMLTGIVVEAVEHARESLDTIRRGGPYQLDRVTVDRITRVWTESSDLNRLFAEQGRRWRNETAGTRHADDVTHYCALVDEERALIDEILATAHRLETVTIDALLAKSDLEVGTDAVLDPTMSPWPKPPPEPDSGD